MAAQKLSTSFNLNAFRQEIASKGVLKTHTFTVDIPVPTYLRNDPQYSDITSVKLRCESASMPGIALAEAQGPPLYGYGPVEFNPYGVMHDQMTLSFVLDKSSTTYSFFYDWLNVIVSYDNSKGLGGTKTYGNSVGVFKTYEVGYKHKFSVDMTITMFDENFVETSKVTLYKAFPRGIQGIDLNWQNQDAIAKLAIPFTYREYTIEFPQLNTQSTQTVQNIG